LDSRKKFVTDSNIFYSGIPFQTTSDYVYYVTPDIREEINHIKRRIDGLNLLITAGKVIIHQVDIHILSMVRQKCIDLGQTELSRADCSVIALSLQLHMPILSTDYALANAAKYFSINILTPGKKNFVTKKTTKYCSICKIFFDLNSRFCNKCGNSLVLKQERIR
jgi:rRNA maturation endonuclease Nob1